MTAFLFAILLTSIGTRLLVYGLVGVSFRHAIAKSGLGTAMLKNQNGKFVLPTTETITAGASVLDPRTPPDERLSLVFATGDDSYPLVNYEYAVVSIRQPDQETAAALRKSINSVGRDRLTEILGKRNTDQLYDLLRAAKITRTDPAHRVTESGTVPNALVLAEKILKHIPGAKTVVGAKHAISDLTERGRAADAVKQSTRTPLEVAAEEAERRASRRTLRLRRADTSLQALRGASPGGAMRWAQPRSVRARRSRSAS